MSLNKNPDLEPLIESAGAANSSRWRFNRKVKIPGLINRRRDPTKTYQEKCGKIRLGVILCAFAFLLIYLSNLKPYQHLMVVRIPEDDPSMPGPKGNYLALLSTLIGLFCKNLYKVFVDAVILNLFLIKILLETIRNFH